MRQIEMKHRSQLQSELLPTVSIEATTGATSQFVASPHFVMIKRLSDEVWIVQRDH